MCVTPKKRFRVRDTYGAAIDPGQKDVLILAHHRTSGRPMCAWQRRFVSKGFEPNFEDALAMQNLLDAIQRSSDEGRVLKLG